MLRTIKLCMKMQKRKEEDTEFPSYFGYKVDKQEDGSYKTREYPTVAQDGTTVMKAKSFKVGLSEIVKAKLTADGANFPYLITFDDEVTDKDGKKVNYNKVDKDKEGNVRLDKYGRRHAVMVINAITDFVACPRTNIDFDDIEEFE